MSSEEHHQKLRDDSSVVLETSCSVEVEPGAMNHHFDKRRGDLVDEVGPVAMTLVDIELAWSEHLLLLEKVLPHEVDVPVFPVNLY